MPGFVQVQAHSAIGLIAPTQGPNMGSTAISLTNASESVTASQIEGTPQPQGPSSTPIHIPSTVIDTKVNASVSLSAFSDMGSHLAPDYAEPTKHLYVPNAIVAIARPVKQLGGPGTFQSHDGDVLGKTPPLRNNTSASSTRLPIATDGEITTQDSRSQTITANPESQNIFTSGLTLSKGSAPTLGSGASIPVLAPQISDTQPSIPSDSLVSYATTMPTLSKKPSFLTVSGQTVTADSLGQHSTDIQPLTKGSLITVSGTTISLAPNESHINVGMSTVNFGPSATVDVGSGSNGTEVQRFSGNALGARDGLWGSSPMFLVFFVVLLWL